MGSVVKYDRTLFEPEHDRFRESYRAFLERHVAPYHEQWEQDKIVDRGVWLEAGKQGFLGMAVPEEYGGGGDPDFRYNVIVTEETTAGRYSGMLFTTLDNADVNPNTYQGFAEWFVADARANYRVDQHWTASLGVDNLLNRKYFLFHPFPQRTFVGGVKFGF